MYSTIIKPKQRVVFDASNKEHRDAAGQFLKRNAWSDSPIQFTFHGHGSLDEHILRELTRYYISQEFSQASS